jgi:membrane protease YdiL (CAAX protease family)
MSVIGAALFIPLSQIGFTGITAAVLITVLAEILVILLALALVGKNRQWKDTLYLKNFRLKNVAAGFLAGLTLFIILQIVSIGISLMGGKLKSSNTSSSLGEIDGFTKYVVLLLIVPLVVPLVEELLFRGVIFGFIKNSGMKSQKLSLTIGILASSVMFGAAHFQGLNTPTDLFVILLTAAIGAINCWLVYKTDSLYTAYACHAGYNLATSGVMLLAMAT